MILLKKLFGINNLPKKPKKIIPWIPLTALKQLDDVLKQSHEKPVVIFKHSTRCGISRMVLRQFEKQLDFEANHVKFYFLDLLTFREISDEIAIRFQVHHQSPQLIIIKSDTVLNHCSHYEINATILKKYI